MINRMLALTIGVFAVDYFRLLRIEHQSTFAKPPIQSLLQCQGFTLTAAVTDSIVGIPLKRHTGKLSPHPHVERVMQEQVGQQGANHASYNLANFSFELAVTLSRVALQSRYGAGFGGAPLVSGCFRYDLQRSGKGGLHEPKPTRHLGGVCEF